MPFEAKELIDSAIAATAKLRKKREETMSGIIMVFFWVVFRKLVTNYTISAVLAAQEGIW